MKYKDFYLILILFFSIITLFTIINLKIAIDGNHGHIIGDWLINYSGGFTRRGLSGYLIKLITHLTKIDLITVVTLIQLILTILFFITFLKIIYKKNLTFWFLIAILSPLAFLFTVYDREAVGRKEIILFLTYSLYIYILSKNYSLKNYHFLITGLGLTISLYFHELIIFFIPYFALAYILNNNIKQEKTKFLPILYMFIGPIISILIIFLFGRTIPNDIICTDLINNGLSQHICVGMLTWPTNLGISDHFLMMIRFNYFQNFGLCVLIGIIPVGLFIYKNKISSNKFKFLFKYVVVIIFSIPLFILGLDWGRWINIHYILLLLTLTMTLNPFRQSHKNLINTNEGILIPKFIKINNFNTTIINNLIVLVLVLSYSIIWRMRHYGKFEIFAPLNKLLGLFHNH